MAQNPERIERARNVPLVPLLTALGVPLKKEGHRYSCRYCRKAIWSAICGRRSSSQEDFSATSGLVSSATNGEPLASPFSGEDIK